MRNAAYFIASQGSGARAGLLPSVFAALRQAATNWKNRRQLVRLADFDDHMLADIGLSRRDVRAALDLPFSSDPTFELQLRATRNRRRGWNR
jgi:uncharacterized protein YjiS (DUF1127 family)